MICKKLYIRLLLVSFLILFLRISINSSSRVEETIAKEISQENLHSIIRELCMIGPRQGGTPSGDSASIYLNNKFKQYGISSGIIADPPKLYRIKIKMGSPKTVIGKIEGRDKEKYYILTAHGDSDGGGPGADDNASGVAVVLEIARIFQKFIKERILPKPNYSMKFIIPGSEIYSTKEYIERNKDSLGNILGVINFDQCAAGAKRDCIYMEPNDAPVNEKILRIFEKVASDYSGIDGYWEEWTTNPGLGGTDNYAFLPPQYHGSMRYNSFSIPAIALFSCSYGKPTYVEQTEGWESPDWKGGRKIEIDFAEYYHLSGDTPENTIEKEPYNVVRIAKLAAIALYRMQFK